MNMYRTNGRPGSQSGRVQWGSYGFLAGIAFGIMIGWMFGGLVGAFLRVALALIVIVPLVLLVIAWRKYVSPMLRPPAQQDYEYEDHKYKYFEPVGAIETRGVIRSTVQQPHPR
jgi:membrane protein implicated in regulation of membrane protease activity